MKLPSHEETKYYHCKWLLPRNAFQNKTTTTINQLSLSPMEKFSIFFFWLQSILNKYPSFAHPAHLSWSLKWIRPWNYLPISVALSLVLCLFGSMNINSSSILFLNLAYKFFHQNICSNALLSFISACRRRIFYSIYVQYRVIISWIN